MGTRAKRRKKSAAAQLRPFWMLFLLLAIAAGIGAYYGAAWPGFYPQRISVGGTRLVSKSDVLARAAIAPHANLWLQNMHAAAARIEAIPYVKTAQIHRSLPASVRIVITERRPFAVLQYGAQRVLVDRDLRVLQPADGSQTVPVLTVKGVAPYADGTFVKDPDVLHLRDDVLVLLQSHVAVRSLHYDRFGDLVATTTGGIALLLGDDDDLQKKTSLIDPIVSQVGAAGKKLAAVDLRAPKTPVVVYKP
jgi:cell division protein FtsQ